MKTDIIKKNLVEFLLVGSLPFLGSCNKSFDNLSSKNTNVLNMDVSPTFKFRTTKLVKLEIAALDNVGGAVPGIRFDVYTSNPDKGGLLIMSGVTDKNGILATELKLPADADSLSVGTKSIGLFSLQEIPIEAGTAGCVFGGKLVNSGLKGQEVKTAMSLGKGTTVFQPLGPYTTLGVPTELVKPDDIIDVSFLTDLNNLLPEKISLPSTHPQYFFDSNQSDIILNSASDLWMTFVSEGSGTSNTLAFYKFREGKPPVLATDIDTLFIVFPNIRFSGHNGGLVSGNKVFLGSFPKGTGIGFAMITNGWNGKSLSKGINTFYPDKMLNPEKDLALRNHAVLLNDSGRGRYLLSFEEKIRNSGGGADDDFNDAIFYVTANPVKAVNPENVIVTEYATHDADNDGITDVFDDYPKDPEKAFNNYYPSKGVLVHWLLKIHGLKVAIMTLMIWFSIITSTG
ncbi:MAG: DUF4114 domain-containing protein [Bacteroidales bacterium]|nr:DUF4114 domain-containing protein [Bacteroidales bacterium]